MSKNEIKYYSALKQKKYRESEGLFLIEGNNLIEECLRSGIYRDLLTKIFVRNDYKDKEFLSAVSRANPLTEFITADHKGINALSETVNSQGIIGVVKINPHPEKNYAGNNKSRLIVLLESVNDPGNLGTILRTCYWYGVDKVYLSEGSVDILNSKVLRSSQGAVFHLNIITGIHTAKTAGEYHKNNFNVILTDLNAEEYVSEIKFGSERDYLVIFGNESSGISKPILENKDYKRVRIKGFSECESLNLGVSAGILLDRIRNYR
ncbi:MAG TPA: RNA methyltransferase [Ignavibacteria bacterium]|nr:RNA methyltransferase [Ignavibacteria bacterium]HMR40827.1 RNA methyltransferase [Ignavibacteria bacterium]